MPDNRINNAANAVPLSINTNGCAFAFAVDDLTVAMGGGRLIIKSASDARGLTDADSAVYAVIGDGVCGVALRGVSRPTSNPLRPDFGEGASFAMAFALTSRLDLAVTSVVDGAGFFCSISLLNEKPGLPDASGVRADRSESDICAIFSAAISSAAFPAADGDFEADFLPKIRSVSADMARRLLGNGSDLSMDIAQFSVYKSPTNPFAHELVMAANHKPPPRARKDL